MARFDKDREFFVARDMEKPEGLHGDLVAVYWDEWQEGRPVVEGWRGPQMESEDFARRRLDPYPCWNLVVDLGGFWDCLRGTVIGGEDLG